MIPRYLIEAYAGHHGLINTTPTEEAISIENLGKISELVQADSPKRRLEIYLEWNGIAGWANQIWSITQTKEYTL